jgi:hypothetical protein
MTDTTPTPDDRSADDDYLTRVTLYPLAQWTPEEAAVLAEDIGASEDGLFVQWIRRGEVINRVAALHAFDPAVPGVHADGCKHCQKPWPCATVRALEAK